MGDKTQFMVMAFASKFGLRPVLLGMSAAVVASMAFAVAVGSLVASLIPPGVIQIVAGCLFIGFGLWSLRGGDEEEEDGGKSKLSPFWTVFVALFIGEMGDKTQLTAAVLAAQSAAPIFVWVGSMLGMLLADGLGVVVGASIGKKIPQRVMKWIAAAIFVVFGARSLAQGVPERFLTVPSVIAFVAVMAGLAWALAHRPRPAGQQAAAGE